MIISMRMTAFASALFLCLGIPMILVGILVAAGGYGTEGGFISVRGGLGVAGLGLLLLLAGALGLRRRTRP
jgi:hypothetical protein